MSDNKEPAGSPGTRVGWGISLSIFCLLGAANPSQGGNEKGWCIAALVCFLGFMGEAYRIACENDEIVNGPARERERQKKEAEAKERRRIAEWEAAQKRVLKEQQAVERHRADEERRAEDDRQRARKESAAQARGTIQRFYDENAHFLRDECPRLLLESNLNAAFVDGISAADAWAVSRDLIAQLQPIVAAGMSRQEAERAVQTSRDQRRRALDRQIEDAQRRIERLRDSRLDDDVVVIETAAEQRNIDALVRERAELEASAR